MNDKPKKPSGSSRREFLSGVAARKQIEQAGEQLAEGLLEENVAPESGDTVRLATRAMACEFSVILNPSQNSRQVIAASDALDSVHDLESQLTVYRETSSLLELNRHAKNEAVEVEQNLFALLKNALEIAEETGGAFTPTAIVLNQLWRRCRSQKTPPSLEEMQHAVQQSDFRAVQLDSENQTIAFDQNRAELGFDLSGIGKGYALDVAAKHLVEESVDNFLFHGGHSSIIAKGSHANCEGWPVGIRHPLFPHKRLATMILNDCGFSSSGSGVQFFRHAGKKYGHLFDPRTGFAVDHMLSVTVIASTAAIADALSTAFYVMPIEQTIAYCELHPEIQAILIPQPKQGAVLETTLLGIEKEIIFWEQ